jgi:hypothetical protein
MLEGRWQTVRGRYKADGRRQAVSVMRGEDHQVR